MGHILKDLIEDFIWSWKNDRKNFWGDLVGIGIILLVIYFVLWFLIPTFMYDMV